MHVEGAFATAVRVEVGRQLCEVLFSSTSIDNQGNAPQTSPWDNSEAVLQLKFPLPVCIRLTAKISHKA